MSISSKGKVAVVTGGNKGIGYCIVKSLCQKLNAGTGTENGGIVYLTARNEEKGRAAVNCLNKEGVYPAFHPLDIESKDSVKRLGEHLRTTHGGLDILVNNAGIAYFTNPTAPLEVQAKHTIAVNYFGTVNVCDELFPLLRAKARVVNLSSQLGHLSKINGMEPAASRLRKRFSSDTLTQNKLNDLVNEYIRSVSNGTHQKEGWPNSPYAVSKVAVTALTRIQQREIDKTKPTYGICVNAVHPGWVMSDMTGGKGLYTVEQGAEAPVYAALLPDFRDTPRGQFIWRDTSIVDWLDKKNMMAKMAT